MAAQNVPPPIKDAASPLGDGKHKPAGALPRLLSCSAG